MCNVFIAGFLCRLLYSIQFIIYDVLYNIDQINMKKTTLSLKYGKGEMLHQEREQPRSILLVQYSYVCIEGKGNARSLPRYIPLRLLVDRSFEGTVCDPAKPHESFFYQSFCVARLRAIMRCCKQFYTNIVTKRKLTCTLITRHTFL